MITDTGISAENSRFLEDAVSQGLFPSRETAIDRGLQLLRERHEAIERIKSEAIVLPDMPAVLERRDDGYIKFRGTRIALYLVLDRYFAGASADEIHESFPSVPRPALDEALSYTASHADVARVHLDQQTAIGNLYCDLSKRGPSIEVLRQRFQALHGTAGA
ncbi:MAG: DUF433 domain-containing protein [Planctomycetaceae bacterium]|nr:DUF433 domain-containing protein [Planctomycetaceae bacterium]